jgi:chemotaxis protein MotB
MRPLVLFSAAALFLLAPGCTATQPSGKAYDRPLDSLRAENARLRAQTQSLRDSLQFYDDIDTGQYYRERRTLQDRLTRLTYEVRLLRDGGLTVAVLPVDSVFASAGTTVSAPGARRLKALGRQLQSTYPNRTVRVEGHADGSTLGPTLEKRFDSNWELSSARATAVVRRLIRLTALDRSQFVPVGYGASRPRASNDTASGRRRNRRVRIAVLPLPRNYTRPFETTW